MKEKDVVKGDWELTLKEAKGQQLQARLQLSTVNAVVRWLEKKVRETK